MGAPLVSVVTPVFNAGVFLRPAIESILGQTLGDFEFLLIDDGSTDGSRDTLTALRDPRVRVLLNPKNLGNSAARNRGLDEACGEFVAFLNHDDIAHPTRLAQQVAYLRQTPGIDLLGTFIETTDEQGRPMTETLLPTDDLNIRWFALVETPLRQSSLMVRSGFLQRHALRYDPKFRAHADYDFVARALRHGVAANLPTVLTRYCRHPGCNSTRSRERLIAEGDRISYAAIQRELPAFAITLEDVAEMRAIVTGDQPAGLRRTLALTKNAWRLYLDLFDAFREKYHNHPAVAAVPAPSSPRP